MLDRIDIHIEVPAIEYSDLTKGPLGESSERLRERVQEAREIQYKRLKEHGITTNAHMSSRLVKKHCALDEQAEALLHQAMMELSLSARGYTKILKVARTIADLEPSENLRLEHISEAIQYRNLDRGLWR